jgi:hypothetical protein
MTIEERISGLTNKERAELNDDVQRALDTQARQSRAAEAAMPRKRRSAKNAKAKKKTRH